MDIKQDQLNKKLTSSSIKSISNQQLADESHNQIIKKFKRRRVYSSFKDSIWCVDLADSKDNEGIKFLLCATDIFGK